MAHATARAIRDDVTARRVSAVEVCRDALKQIEASNAALNSFLLVDAADAETRAQKVDARLAAGEAMPLAGVPIAIKDNLCVRGMKTTAASKILESYAPPYDATVIEKLEAAGAVIVGKTNCDEFAMGSSNENSAYGPVRNPWATERTP
ncbi:MAG TPA: amidase, partial [Vicinamibacterales bacterium]|nr:amidase [Vicinamibacterales bacterium]